VGRKARHAGRDQYLIAMISADTRKPANFDDSGHTSTNGSSGGHFYVMSFYEMLKCPCQVVDPAAFLAFRGSSRILWGNRVSGMSLPLNQPTTKGP